MARRAATDLSGRRRSRAKAALLVVLCAVAFAGFVGLGTWQVHRLAWKRDLIARVETRVHAPPVPPPASATWPSFDPAAEEYRHVEITGTFLNDRETLVLAVTARGSGDWVMTPLRTDGGAIVLINRGFVPDDRRDPAVRALGRIAGGTTVTGLLRISEPKGGFLRHNDPAADRWYSRDVAAIAAARGLGTVAPFFIDADATPNSGGWPAGGLTVVSFPNNHLVYALTWYTLAALLAGAGVGLVRAERRSGRR